MQKIFYATSPKTSVQKKTQKLKESTQKQKKSKKKSKKKVLLIQTQKKKIKTNRKNAGLPVVNNRNIENEIMSDEL